MMTQTNTQKWFSNSLQTLVTTGGSETISYGLEIKMTHPDFVATKENSEIDGWKILSQEPKAEKILQILLKRVIEREHKSISVIRMLKEAQTLFFTLVAEKSIERIAITKENEHDVYFIFVGKNATCTITLDEIGSHVVCLYAEEGSKINFETYRKGEQNILSLIEAEIGKDAQYNFISHISGRGHFAEERFTKVSGAHGEVRSSTYIEGGEESVTEVHEYITLDGDNSDADVTVRGVGEKGSRMVVRGNVHAKRDLEGLYGNQSFSFLMLDDGVEIDAMPDLSIETNAVSFSHACAIHDIPEAMSSYLHTRGFDNGEAKKLYIDSFLRKEIIS